MILFTIEIERAENGVAFLAVMYDERQGYPVARAVGDTPRQAALNVATRAATDEADARPADSRPLPPAA